MDKLDIQNTQHWRNYYNDKSIVAKSIDLQFNVSRTRNGEKISQKTWLKTIDYIRDLLSIKENSDVLELCCGNGLVIGELASTCKEAIGIDYSNILLKQLSENYACDNLVTINADVNSYDLGSNKYDSIIIYFSLQHFSEKETYLVVNKCLNALKNGGRMLLGDIPDLEKKWSYINKPSFHVDYFKRLEEDKPKIGYWFQKDYFLAMNSVFTNVDFKIIEQPTYQINSDYRFDVLIQKK
ncbi:class I SAM-dependent methyltransferase [uncultured Algibacter sp.]|uniref:class I SAM-dependent methyltransferase n=1 Tax=uncultured Algibacter sp. TaxID=298659 RepID=UPI00262F8BC5|nr:class I SAM-dependent methyltransferase [uncultured Algibacter sp.]